MTPPQELLTILQFVWQWGWIIAPIVLFFVWKHLWLQWVQKNYAATVEWITLELKIPHSVEHTPKAMEQVFGGLFALKKKSNFKERWWDGKFQLHISMEIVSLGGSIHFFIRTPREFQKLIQSQIYAQYKDAEIIECEDYVARMPKNLPNEDYDLWGTELMFTKEDAYPIRTYRFFEEPSTEKKFIDPLSSLVEFLGELQEGEQVWAQYLIRPADDKWQRDGQRLIDRLIGKKDVTHRTSNVMEDVMQFFVDLMMAVVKPPEPPRELAEEKRVPETLMQHLPPGMRDVVAALEESISKHGFEVVIRLAYIARRDVFSPHNIGAMIGPYNQFSTYNLNGLKPNSATMPSIDYVLKKTRENIRKKNLYRWACDRSFDSIRQRKRMIMNTEELATVYHVPAAVLEVPMLPKIMAKKAEPPSSLPAI